MEGGWREDGGLKGDGEGRRCSGRRSPGGFHWGGHVSKRGGEGSAEGGMESGWRVDGGRMEGWKAWMETKLFRDRRKEDRGWRTEAREEEEGQRKKKRAERKVGKRKVHVQFQFRNGSTIVIGAILIF
jgi:hypothetical protein